MFCFAFLCQLNIESAILFKDDYVVNMVHIYIRLSASFTLCFDFVVRERKEVAMLDLLKLWVVRSSFIPSVATRLHSSL